MDLQSIRFAQLGKVLYSSRYGRLVDEAVRLQWMGLPMICRRTCAVNTGIVSFAAAVLACTEPADIGGMAVYELVRARGSAMPATIDADNFGSFVARSGTLTLDSGSYTKVTVVAKLDASGKELRVDTVKIVGRYTVRNDSVLLRPPAQRVQVFKAGGDSLVYVGPLAVTYIYKQKI